MLQLKETDDVIYSERINFEPLLKKRNSVTLSRLKLAKLPLQRPPWRPRAPQPK